MTMEQIYQLMNSVTQEVIGDTAVVAEDLSNVVDIGTTLSNMTGGIDNFVRALNDHIGRVLFVDRVYQGRGVSVLRDGWEYGSILEKIRADLPEAQANSSWNLQDGQTYDPNVFTKPSVHAKFYNDRVTYEIPISITRKQVKSAFSNAMQLNGLISMINNSVQNSMTLKTDALIMRTLNSAIGETIHDAYGANPLSGGSHVRAVNLLYLYNQMGNNLTPANALYDADFIRFASFTIKMYMRRMQGMSKLFNIGETVKFTPADRMHAVFLDEFKNAAEVYLYDGLNQFNVEGIRLPASIETVDFWQGSGTGYAFADTSAINITTPSGETVSASGIIGLLFDHDALGVANLERETTSDYNARAQFYNYWHKFETGLFLDTDENIVVFIVA